MYCTVCQKVGVEFSILLCRVLIHIQLSFSYFLPNLIPALQNTETSCNLTGLQDLYKYLAAD